MENYLKNIIASTNEKKKPIRNDLEKRRETKSDKESKIYFDEDEKPPIIIKKNYL